MKTDMTDAFDAVQATTMRVPDTDPLSISLMGTVHYMAYLGVVNGLGNIWNIAQELNIENGMAE